MKIIIYSKPTFDAQLWKLYQFTFEGVMLARVCVHSWIYFHQQSRLFITFSWLKTIAYITNLLIELRLGIKKCFTVQHPFPLIPLQLHNWLPIHVYQIRFSCGWSKNATKCFNLNWWVSRTIPIWVLQRLECLYGDRPLTTTTDAEQTQVIAQHLETTLASLTKWPMTISGHI